MISKVVFRSVTGGTRIWPYVRPQAPCCTGRQYFLMTLAHTDGSYQVISVSFESHVNTRWDRR